MTRQVCVSASRESNESTQQYCRTPISIELSAAHLQEDVGGTFLDDEGEQPTAAELNAARQAHLSREHRLPQDKDMSYEEIDRFVKVQQDTTRSNGMPADLNALWQALQPHLSADLPHIMLNPHLFQERLL